MKVILEHEVDNLGLAGDVVDVANGYGRNFLLPRGMAIRATKGAMKEAEALTRSRKATEAETLGDARAAKDAIEGRVLQITARVDDRGHLYGSVGVNDIHRVLRERGHQIEKKRIELRGTIKEIGTYEVPIHVHPQVEALATIDVLDETGEVIAGQIEEPEVPPLPGEVTESAEGEPAPATEGEPAPATEDTTADAEAGEAEPVIDSVESLVEQALEAAEDYDDEAESSTPDEADETANEV